jgi:hypothetical protein
MKKIAIALLILSIGVLPSCTKQTIPKPIATLERSTIAFKKDLGTAD